MSEFRVPIPVYFEVEPRRYDNRNARLRRKDPAHTPERQEERRQQYLASLMALQPTSAELLRRRDVSNHPCVPRGLELIAAGTVEPYAQSDMLAIGHARRFIEGRNQVTRAHQLLEQFYERHKATGTEVFYG